MENEKEKSRIKRILSNPRYFALLAAAIVLGGIAGYEGKQVFDRYRYENQTDH